MVQVGSHTTPDPAPEDDIAAADIVVGKGRAVLDAMSCGRPAYVYDVYGADGWVTAETYDAIEADAIAGQALPRRRRRRTTARRPGGVRPRHGPRQPAADPQAPQAQDPRRRPGPPVLGSWSPGDVARASTRPTSWPARCGCGGGPRSRCSSLQASLRRAGSELPRLASRGRSRPGRARGRRRGRARRCGPPPSAGATGPARGSHAQGEGDVRSGSNAGSGSDEALRLVRRPMTELVPSDRAPQLLVAPDVVIPDDAVIGANVVIRAGVELGRGVVHRGRRHAGQGADPRGRVGEPAGRPRGPTRIGDGTVIGSHTVVSAGADIGAAGLRRRPRAGPRGRRLGRTRRSATHAPSAATPSSATESGCRVLRTRPRASSSRTTASSDRP